MTRIGRSLIFWLPVLWLGLTTPLAAQQAPGFTPGERQAIPAYFQQHPIAAPAQAQRGGRDGRTDQAKTDVGSGPSSGLSQIQAVPPGVASQIQRLGTLPAAAPRQPLPGDLEARLPPRPERRLIVGRDVLLLGGGDLILDVLRDVVR
jgi:hypothetical protein